MRNLSPLSTGEFRILSTYANPTAPCQSLKDGYDLTQGIRHKLTGNRKSAKMVVNLLRLIRTTGMMVIQRFKGFAKRGVMKVIFL
jgi:hypothetical protein